MRWAYAWYMILNISSNLIYTSARNVHVMGLE
jgi:hypothetical protein